MNAAADWRPELERLELSLLWAWLEGPSFRTRWTPDARDFSTDRLAALAKACSSMLALGLRASPSTQVVEQLRNQGDLNKHWPFGQGLVSSPSATPDEDLVRWRTLRIRFALRQRLVELVTGMTPGGSLSAEREGILVALGAASDAGSTPSYTLPEGLMMAYNEGTAQQRAGYYSGFTDLDGLTGGLRPGHVWVLGAPTNWGKSSLLLAFADHHISVHSSGVLIVTCEDAPSLLFSRWLARRAEIPGRALRDARMTSAETERAAAAINEANAAGERPVMLDGRGRPVEQLARDIRAHVSVHGIRLALVDYLQCIGADWRAQDRRGEINHVARTLTDAIKTSGAAGMLASQLTGEDIRESRDVEHAAEVVLIGRKSEEGVRQLLVKKNKTGPADAVLDLEWNDDNGSFVTRREESYDSIFDDAE